VVAGTYGKAYQTLRLAVLAEAGWRCAYCHQPATTADHVIPVPRGGTHDRTNLVAACRRDNTSKGSRTLTEWIATGLAPAPARQLADSRAAQGLPC
jgi:5-methylcytosine-specific restriction endonuclease McrA